MRRRPPSGQSKSSVATYVIVHVPVAPTETLAAGVTVAVPDPGPACACDGASGASAASAAAHAMRATVAKARPRALGFWRSVRLRVGGFDCVPGT